MLEEVVPKTKKHVPDRETYQGLSATLGVIGSLIGLLVVKPLVIDGYVKENFASPVLVGVLTGLVLLGCAVGGISLAAFIARRKAASSKQSMD
ncbi:MAG: hypothetical protein NXI14_06610 [bacterium]|nr:hypothetical protein [bacterium]